MKIGVLLWELDVSGGTQRQALCLARELGTAGDEVTVYAPRIDRGRCYPELMEAVATLDLGGGRPDPPSPGKAGRILRRFLGRAPDLEWNRRLAETIPADLDLLNVHELIVYPAAVFWKERTRKPIVWMMNDVPAEFLRKWEPRRPWRGLDRAFNGKAWDERNRRRMAGRFDRIVVLSRMEGRKLTACTGLGADVVPSGLDLGAFPFRRREPPGRRALRLFSNSILYPHRRLEDIVGALQILERRGIPFVWSHAGATERSSSYFALLRRLIEDAGLAGCAEFLGTIGDRELVGRLQEADVFLFPNTPQSWGIAPFEAMACGTPVIVSRGAGAAEVLADGSNALLVDPCSPGQIADAVERLGTDRPLWESLHREGRKFVEENIRWDLYAARMREIFRRAVRS